MEVLGIVQRLKRDTKQATIGSYAPTEEADVTCDYHFAAALVDYLEGSSSVLPDFSSFAHLFDVDNSRSDIGIIVSVGKGLIVRSNFSLEWEHPINNDIGRIDLITASSSYCYLVRYRDDIGEIRDSKKYLNEVEIDENLVLNVQRYLADCKKSLCSLRGSRIR